MDNYLRKLCREKEVSIQRFEEILEIINSDSGNNGSTNFKPIFPTDKDMRIIKSFSNYTCSLYDAVSNISNINKEINISGLGRKNGDQITFDEKDLYSIGIELLPHTAYGILNGGSATSYADVMKNEQFHPKLYSSLKELFDSCSAESKGKTKSLTSAYINPDSSRGYTFLELKLRNLLLLIQEYKNKFPERGIPKIPVFQMTSIGNDDEVKKAEKELSESPLLRDLIDDTGYNPFPFLTGVQPLLAAVTPFSEENKREIFTFTEKGTEQVLALPGGHGECFNTLKPVFSSLFSNNIHFAYLTNSDNLGSTIDPREIAILALSGTQAGFDFSLKTDIDVKGGVLLLNEKNNLTCGDMGAAVSKEEVNTAGKEGNPVLFNCATGLFNLAYLTKNIDFIRNMIPIRISEQNKDRGHYAQAEQITWEVIGLLSNPVIYQVNKFDRFLASKLLIENLLTSGIGLNFLTKTEPGSILKKTSSLLHEGFKEKMKSSYKMKLINKQWHADKGIKKAAC